MDRLLNQAGMKDFLKSEYKLVFFPKRQLKIPRLNYKFLTKKFGNSNADKIKDVDCSFNIFLNDQPIGDHFGSDHISRASWRGGLVAKFGQVFKEAYVDHNQFRGGNLAHIIRKTFILSELTKVDPVLTESLKEIEQELTEAMHGKNSSGKKYNDMENLNDKLEIVHLFEDKIIDMLNRLS